MGGRKLGGVDGSGKGSKMEGCRSRKKGRRTMPGESGKGETRIEDGKMGEGAGDKEAAKERRKEKYELTRRRRRDRR